MKRINLACAMSALLGCAIAAGCTDRDQVTSAPESGGAAPTGSKVTSDDGDMGGNNADAAGSGGATGASVALGDAGAAEAGEAGAGGNAVAAPGTSSGGSSTGGGSSRNSSSGSGAVGVGGVGGGTTQPLAGYTLFAPMDANGNYTQTELVDMTGTLVHTWNLGGIGQKMLPGGDLIGSQGVFPGDYDSVDFQQVSWAGEVKWSFSNFAQAADGTWGARSHHDFEREGNPVGYYAPGQDFVADGNTLVLAHTLRTVPDIRPDPLDDDVIYELDGSGAFEDTLWTGADHIGELGFDEAALNDIRTRDPGTTLEWLHGNSMALVGPNHWFDEGHAEFNPNNIIYSSRNASFVVIISRETKQVVWRIGPDFAGRPEERLGQFAGQHNPHIIPVGLPGAGNMLVFDDGGASGYGGADDANRYSRNWSRVLEFNPVTMDIVWQYGSAAGSDAIFSPILSNAQRLPNGDTVITIGTTGKVIEVNADNQIVWQYEAPPGAGGALNWLYRSYRIPPEWLPAGENAAHGNYPSWADLYPVGVRPTQ